MHMRTECAKDLFHDQLSLCFIDICLDVHYNNYIVSTQINSVVVEL